MFGVGTSGLFKGSPGYWVVRLGGAPRALVEICILRGFQPLNGVS